MFADLDYSSVDVRQDVLDWGKWIGTELKLSGMRLDAIKHYSWKFLKTFVGHLDQTVGKDWLFVGEYWKSDCKFLGHHIDRFGGRLSLFDVPLVHNLSYASSAPRADLRAIFRGTLSNHRPAHAVVRLVYIPTVGDRLS